MNRREFLKVLGGSVIALALYPIVKTQKPEPSFIGAWNNRRGYTPDLTHPLYTGKPVEWENVQIPNGEVVEFRQVIQEIVGQLDKSNGINVKWFIDDGCGEYESSRYQRFALDIPKGAIITNARIVTDGGLKIRGIQVEYDKQ